MAGHRKFIKSDHMTITLDTKLHSAVKSFAYYAKKSKSECVREALAQYLTKETGVNVDEYLKKSH